MLIRLLLALTASLAALASLPPGSARAELARHSVPCGAYGGQRAFCVYDVRPGQAAGLSCHGTGLVPAGYDASVLAHDGEDYIDVLDHSPAGAYGPITIQRWGNGTATARVSRGTWDVAVWCRAR